MDISCVNTRKFLANLIHQIVYFLSKKQRRLIRRCLLTVPHWNIEVNNNQYDDNPNRDR